MIEIVAFDLEELEQIMEENEVDNLLQVRNGAANSDGAFTVEVILANSTGENVFWQKIYYKIDGPIRGPIAEIEIEYSSDGKPYFELEDNSRRWIEDFIRNNYGRGVKL
jgi:hypothetical protein